jgi:hypothetical protein
VPLSALAVSLAEGVFLYRFGSFSTALWTILDDASDRQTDPVTNGVESRGGLLVTSLDYNCKSNNEILHRS